MRMGVEALTPILAKEDTHLCEVGEPAYPLFQNLNQYLYLINLVFIINGNIVFFI